MPLPWEAAPAAEFASWPNVDPELKVPEAVLLPMFPKGLLNEVPLNGEFTPKVEEFPDPKRPLLDCGWHPVCAASKRTHSAISGFGRFLNVVMVVIPSSMIGRPVL